MKIKLQPSVPEGALIARQQNSGSRTKSTERRKDDLGVWRSLGGGGGGGVCEKKTKEKKKHKQHHQNKQANQKTQPKEIMFGN